MKHRIGFWLLRRVGAWLGLKVGIQAWDIDGSMKLLVLAAHDGETLRVLATLADIYAADTNSPKPGRRHVEWTH